MDKKLAPSDVAASSPIVAGLRVTYNDLSPMTNLALDLSGTTIDGTPCRKLSLSGLSDESANSSGMDTSISTTPVNDSRSISAAHRSPRRLLVQRHLGSYMSSFGKENTTQIISDHSPLKRTVSSPYKSTLESPAFKSSPVKPLQCSTNVNGVPSFEDTTSRDSGYVDGEQRKNKFPSLVIDAEKDVDDGFADVGEPDGEPRGLSTLLLAPIAPVVPEPPPKLHVRRCLSMDLNESTPPRGRDLVAKQVRSEPAQASKDLSVILEEEPKDAKEPTFKRPEPPGMDDDALQRDAKRARKASSFDLHEATTKPVKMLRSRSASEAIIMNAVQRSSQNPELIGDFSKQYVLPLVNGKHQDLKSISPAVLSDLIAGRYDCSVNSYVVVDCRYPYEYEGGHIDGAKNFFTKEQIVEEFLSDKSEAHCDTEEPVDSTVKRDILIFHCEFSSERGPTLSRFLRNKDRDLNKETYPALHYPEIYLLEGGYKAFYEYSKEQCEPQTYTPMLDPRYEAAMRTFRAKSKSQNGDMKRHPSRTLKRLGLM